MLAGHAHMSRTAYREAAEEFQAADRVAPNSSAARINAAIALLLASEPDGALSLIDALTGPALDSPRVEYIRGLSLLNSDRPTEAVEPLRRALQAHPTDIAIRFQLGRALRRAGQADEARELFESIVDSGEGRFHVGAAFQLAEICRLAGDTACARRYLALRDRNLQLAGRSDDERAAAQQLEISGRNRLLRPIDAHVDFQPDPEPIAVKYTPVAVDWSASALAVVPLHVDDEPGPVYGRAPSRTLRQAEHRVIEHGARGWRVWRLENASMQPESTAIESSNNGPFAGTIVADFDNAGGDDALFFGPGGICLLRQGPAGAFADVTANAGLANGSRWKVDAALAMDFDQEGDLDLVLAVGGNLHFLRNAEGRFTDATSEVKLPDIGPIGCLAAGEMNDDDAIDLIAGGAQRSAVLFNAGFDDFSAAHLPPMIRELPSRAVVVDDLNNDGVLDAAWLGDGPDGGQTVFFGDATWPPVQLATQAEGLCLHDFDHDGFLDVVTAGAAGPQLWRNAGAGRWTNQTAETGWAAHKVPHGSVLEHDLDQDGCNELLFTGAASPAVVFRSSLPPTRPGLRVQVRGNRSNRSGLGTRIDARSGSIRVFRSFSTSGRTIGVRDAGQLDSLSSIWPNGVTDAEENVAAAESRLLIEPIVASGSCPYLYVRNTAGEMEFVSDILGGAPLGLYLAPGRFAPADTDELVVVGALDRYRSTDGRVHVEVTNELREIIYLDIARMVVAYHAPDEEVHATDRLAPPPFAPSRVRAIRNLQAPLAARNHDGQDVTESLRAIDNRRVGPTSWPGDQLRGRAAPHAIELDFGPLESDRAYVLALTGWLMWGEASTNRAAAQIPAADDPFPRLEVRTTSGEWKPLDVVVGAPAGRTKTILVDLPQSRLSAADAASPLQLRLSSSLELYWDRIVLAEDAGNPEREVLAPGAAVLRTRGVSQVRRETRDSPLIPAYDQLVVEGDIAALPADASLPWRSVPAGYYTRHGDVMPLLQAVDDCYVIMSCGDGLQLTFSLAGLRGPRQGQSATLVFYSDGWDKDSDASVVTGNSVEPLPFHAHDEQRYGLERYPHDDTWLWEYNTRKVDLGSAAGGN